MVTPINISPAQLQEAKNRLCCKKAAASYVDFIQLMHPDREDDEDYTKSAYIVKEFHRVIIEAVDAVERGELMRLIISMPPRIGKTETAAKKFIPYCIGRSPHKHIIYATYGSDLSKECGDDVIKTMASDRYKQVFPKAQLSKGGKAKDRIKTEQGGVGIFVGRGGALSGKGADLLIVDDIVKDDAEANSSSTMESIWHWFNKVAMTRLMSDKSSCIIIMTRWSDNDIIGRMLDPDSPHYDPIEAAKWKEIKISALCEDEDNDPMLRKNGEALWPERFSAEHLEGLRRSDPRGFACLQQQNPTPDCGVFFDLEGIKEYYTADAPEGMRIYASSDHAVSVKQHNDMTCMLIVGVDDKNNIWLLDCFWQRADSIQQIEAMLNLMRKWDILTWWAEDGQISKSILPLLRKRMAEENVWCSIDPVGVPTDKQVRSQSIKGMMSMGKVYFPRDQPWFQPAKAQLLKFGGGSRFDDFVDALAHVGQQLAKLVKGHANSGSFTKTNSKSFGAFKKQSELEQRKSKVISLVGGF